MLLRWSECSRIQFIFADRPEILGSPTLLPITILITITILSTIAITMNIVIIIIIADTLTVMTYDCFKLTRPLTIIAARLKLNRS